MVTQSFDYLETIEPIKGNLIKSLQLVQKKESFLSDEALQACGEHCGVSPAEVEGVVSFYAQFKRQKPGKYQISVCDGTACHIKGTPLVLEWIYSELNLRDGESDENGLFSMETVACLGCCSLAPVFSVNGEVFGNVDRKQTKRIIKQFKEQG